VQEPADSSEQLASVGARVLKSRPGTNSSHETRGPSYLCPRFWRFQFRPPHSLLYPSQYQWHSLTAALVLAIVKPNTSLCYAHGDSCESNHSSAPWFTLYISTQYVFFIYCSLQPFSWALASFSVLLVLYTVGRTQAHKHPRLRRDSNPRSQCWSGRRQFHALHREAAVNGPFNIHFRWVY
jgi:hypothetical protein